MQLSISRGQRPVSAQMRQEAVEVWQEKLRHRVALGRLLPELRVCCVVNYHWGIKGVCYTPVDSGQTLCHMVEFNGA